MILVDTTIWIDHLRSGNATLARLLGNSAVLAHPWVTGELALGNLSRRDEVIRLLHGLPEAALAGDDEVLTLIEQEALYGAGIGYVHAHLLAATRLTPDTTLWTRDKRLSAVAARLGLAFSTTSSSPITTVSRGPASRSLTGQRTHTHRGHERTTVRSGKQDARPSPRTPPTSRRRSPVA